MPSHNGILFAVTIMLCMVNRSSAIYCFYCNSVNNSACINPLEYDEETRGRIIPIINCDTAIPAMEKINFFCRKIVQTIYRPHHESEYRVTRGCGWVTDSYNKKCYSDSNADHHETVCQCDSDHCNTADGVNSVSATVLFIALAACLYFYR